MPTQIGWRIRAAKQSTMDAWNAINELDGEDSKPILAELDLAMKHLRLAEAGAIALNKILIDRRGGIDRRIP